MPRLFLRVSSTGARGWMLKYRLGSQQKKAKLGVPGVMPVEVARTLAREIIHGAKKGTDRVATLRTPEPVPESLPAHMTRAQLIDRYIKEWATPRNRKAR